MEIKGDVMAPVDSSTEFGIHESDMGITIALGRIRKAADAICRTEKRGKGEVLEDTVDEDVWLTYFMVATTLLVEEGFSPNSQRYSLKHAAYWLANLACSNHPGVRTGYTNKP